MSNSKLKFHTLCGENISLENNNTKAKWQSKTSGGGMFGARPLGRDEKVRIEVNGSGRLKIGILQYNPEELSDREVHCAPLKSLDGFKEMNEIRIHKRTCFITLTMSADGSTVSSAYNDRIFTQNLDKDGSVWLAIDIQFGKVSAKIAPMTGTKSRQLLYSYIHGHNISLDHGKTTAQSIDINPASICFLENPMHTLDSITINCSPIKENDRTPRRYHISMFIANSAPSELCKASCSLFSTSVAHADRGPSDLLEIVTLATDDCNGNITATVTQNKEMHYIGAAGKTNFIRLQNVSVPCWVAFRLYRVELSFGHVSSTNLSAVASPADEQGYEVPVQRKLSQTYLDVFPGAEESVRGEHQSLLSNTSDPGAFYITPTHDGCSPPVHQVSIQESVLSQRKQNVMLLNQSAPQSKSRLRSTSSGSETDMQQERPDQLRPHSIPVKEQEQPPRPKLVELGGNIQNRYVDIKRSLMAVPLLDYLFQGHIICMEEFDRIKVAPTTNEANDILLGILIRKPVPPEVMIEALNETKQAHLIPMLFP